MRKPAPRRPGSAPAKPVLAGLTALVLAGHWFALGGELPNWWGKNSAPSDQTALADASTSPAATQPAGLPPPPAPEELPARVAISTVRWIVPAPPPPPPAPPPPPPKKPPKKPKPPPQPPEPPEPEPETAVEALLDAAPAYELPSDPIPGLDTPPPSELSEQDSEAAEAPAQPPSPAVSAVEKAAPAALDTTHASTGTASPLPPAQLPPSARLRYDVAGQAKGFSYSASGQLDWNQDGSTYEARMEVSAFLVGSIVQTSTGRVSATGLAPDRFIDKRRKEKTTEFDRAAKRIRYNSNARVDPLLAGTQDRISISLQLAGLLNANPQYVEGQVLSLPVSGSSSTEPWLFAIGPETTLDLPAGPLLTRLLTRQPRREGDTKVQIWLAPTLENLPVRIRLSESNGDFIDQRLEEMPAMSSSTPSS